MSAVRFAHHFVPHHHPDTDEHHPSTSSGLGETHRGHALSNTALFAYFLIFAITVSAFWLVRIKAPQILGTATYSADQIIELTNVKRAENGLPPLKSNSKLATAAQAKASDMFSNNYWAHFSPQGKTPWQFIKSVGYRYIYAGENLARDFNDAQSVVNAWMASPTHRSNMLDKNFKEIGVDVETGNLTGREGVLVVQMFGSSVSQVPANKPIAKNPNNSNLSQTPVQGETEEVQVVQESQAATVLASRQFSIAKGISFALIGFVFLLFVVEVAVASKKAHVSVGSSTWAHMGLLGLVLFAVWYAVQGIVV